MNKKLILLATAILVLALAVVGCSSESRDEPAATGGNEPVTPDIKEDEDEFIVGFIYVSPAGDGGWSTSHDNGRLMVERELGVKTIYRENVVEDQGVENVIREMIDEGANVIFATSYGYMDYVENISSEFPDVAFLHASGTTSTDNMNNYFGRIYQARYLTGIVAGLKTETNHIGYVGAYAIPEVIRGINAFTLGAQSVNSDVEVSVRWTNTWYDPATEKEAAIALLDEGVDIIAQHQDTAGPQQAAEERGVWSVGYHTDMTEVAPDAHMTAAIWDWGPYYVSQVESAMEGNWTPVNYWGGMEDGIVQISPLTNNAPDEAEDILEDIQTSIVEGSFKVFEGPIYNQEGELAVEEGTVLSDDELLSMFWFVQGVNGSID
ncbi:nucleoside-binding protein [Natranaerovirga hydrolytica]|uniref:Nucleoside-binding protein n=1 Tax=Natranaerovirga hydrolytica TaxID=680378 RepID=A0A4R1MX31_9FIRM|nr:BMP family ABC transporter substrate-binding protein [Natranaerovirga hydrolytica]TCK97756.1 nucleoside-binding protein [Natranaerovirga hydrolytica]